MTHRRTRKSKPKTASVIHFHMGDSYLTTLAQETVPLARAMAGYGKSVLLKHDVDAGPFELSAKAEKKAWRVADPTRENLVNSIIELDEEGYEIDVYIFAHGSHERFTASPGAPHKSVHVTSSFLRSRLGTNRHIRMVWQCNCYGASMNGTWLSVGARAAMGTQGVNFYPTRFRRFAKLFNKGANFGEAVAKSDTAAIRLPVHAYIQALAYKGGHGAVLGDKDAARNYFTTKWFHGWDERFDGKGNMNEQSRYVVHGDPAVRRDEV